MLEEAPSVPLAEPVPPTDEADRGSASAASLLLPISARTEKALAALATGMPNSSAAIRRRGATCATPPRRGATTTTAAWRCGPARRPRPGSCSRPLSAASRGRGCSRAKPYGRSLKVALVYDGSAAIWKSCLPLPELAAVAAEVDAALER